MGFAKEAYNYLKNSLFFSLLFDIIFNAYFAFVFSSMILVNANEKDTNYHEKLITFSWILLIICNIIIPSIIIYAAKVPEQKRKTLKYKE